MGFLKKWGCASLSLLFGVLVFMQQAAANEYRYYSLDLPQGWYEKQKETDRPHGVKHVSFRQKGDQVGLDIFSKPFPELGKSPSEFQVKLALTVVLAAIEQQAKIKFTNKRYDPETGAMEVKTTIEGHEIDGRLFYRSGVMFAVASSGLSKEQVLSFLETLKVK